MHAHLLEPKEALYLLVKVIIHVNMALLEMAHILVINE